MRIAVLSDIHGHIRRLDAVIQDFQNHSVDRIISLGDVATLGPSPKEVIERLKDIQCECIMGNHDEFLLRPELIRSYTDVPYVINEIEKCAQKLGDGDLAYIATFKSSLRITHAKHTLFCFHGTPESNTGELLVTASTEQLDKITKVEQADVIAAGHIHVQMARRHRQKMVVNPGSVGMPFETNPFMDTPVILPWAEYAIVEFDDRTVSVTLRHVSLD